MKRTLVGGAACVLSAVMAFSYEEGEGTPRIPKAILQNGPKPDHEGGCEEPLWGSGQYEGC